MIKVKVLYPDGEFKIYFESIRSIENTSGPHAEAISAEGPSFNKIAPEIQITKVMIKPIMHWQLFSAR
mgnify:CR=1 FL=1